MKASSSCSPISRTVTSRAADSWRRLPPSGLRPQLRWACWEYLGRRRVLAQDSPPEVTPEKWEKGKGWGWVWGDDDELGNLNELGPELTLKALSKVKEGNVYDLGLAYDRRSYKFVGHSSGEIMSFRTPE